MKTKDQNTPLDSRAPDETQTIRCPRLGHQVPFSYCEQENGTHPCFKSLDCWHTKFNVVEFFKQQLDQDAFQRIFEKPVKPKLFSLLDLIEQAKTAGDKKA